jgi:hypothetical protein
MADYTFMKTGDNMIDDDDEIPEAAFDMASIMTLFTKKGIENTSCYVKHSGRPSITSEDIKRGLMIEMYLFSKRPDLFPEVQEIKEALMEDSDSDSPDSELPETEDNTPFVKSQCTCALCKAMNDVYTRWESFQPQSVIEKILYDNISKVPT